MIEQIRKLNITSDMAYIAAAFSILLSIGLWLTRRDEDSAHAERFGIFVGLWAPTLATLGNALANAERKTINL
jgi:hypothetical protein